MLTARKKMKLRISDWCVSNNTIKFNDDRLCNCLECSDQRQKCQEVTEIQYDVENSVYYITCQHKLHRQRVSDAIADRIDEYCDIKKIIISDRESDFVLTIPVAQSINYKKRFG
jgi:hypothetical protein